MAVAMAVAMAAGGGDCGSGSSVWWWWQLMTTAVKDIPFLGLSSTLLAAGGRAATAAGGRATTVTGGRAKTVARGRAKLAAGERTKMVAHDQGSSNNIFPRIKTLPPLSAILTLMGDCTDSYVKSYREISFIGAEIFYIGRVKNLRFR